MTWVKSTRRGGGLGKLFVDGVEYATHREDLEFGESAGMAFHANPDAKVYALIPETRIDFELMGYERPPLTPPQLHGVTLDPGLAGSVSRMTLDLDHGGRGDTPHVKVLFAGDLIAYGNGVNMGTVYLVAVEQMELDIIVEYLQGTFTFTHTVTIEQPT